jgi:hypothetical protein
MFIFELGNRSVAWIKISILAIIEDKVLKDKSSKRDYRVCIQIVTMHVDQTVVTYLVNF